MFRVLIITLPILLVFLPLSTEAIHGNHEQASLLDPKKFLIIGHRGVPEHAPEHTIVSYELAKQFGADYIELDLRMTKDGHLISIHDETVDRTTNGTGNVDSLTLDEIKRLDAGSWFNKKYPERSEDTYVGLEIPTLEEIIGHFGKNVNYYIELKEPDKYPELEEKLLATLTASGLTNSDFYNSNIIIQSFSSKSLTKVHRLNKNIPLIQLLNEASAVLSEESIVKWKKYAVGVGPNQEFLNKNYVKTLRDNGLLVHPYVVNNKEDLTKMIEWGVTGVFTNRTDRIITTLIGL
jgi:glycerophosphoryl diester phosphodiesterase